MHGFVWDFAGFVGVERKVQKSYWEEHSRDLTVESMMLDSRAKDLDKEERPEVYLNSPTFIPPSPHFRSICPLLLIYIYLPDIDLSSLS